MACLAQALQPANASAKQAHAGSHLSMELNYDLDAFVRCTGIGDGQAKAHWFFERLAFHESFWPNRSNIQTGNPIMF
jgi:hypothetical protein